MYTQPQPTSHACPGPPTKLLTEPYVAMVVMASTKPPSVRLPMKYSLTKPPSPALRRRATKLMPSATRPKEEIFTSSEGSFSMQRMIATIVRMACMM